MRRTLAFSLFSLLLFTAIAQSGRPLRVAAWNVENLFDTLHDKGFADEEFLPQSERHWTSYRYWQKLTDVARVLAAMGEDGVFPDLIGLCEVENDSVLTTLTQRSVLRQLHYSYVMTQSMDVRGIDVALLYQPARFRLLESRSIRIPSREHDLRPTRDILYAKGLVFAGDGSGDAAFDTLHVLVVHLPSRAGGHEGDRNRLLAARTLWAAVDSLQSLPSGSEGVGDWSPRVVVMGDFNASGSDRIFKGSPLRITDDPKAAGTYCYQGLWQWLDHILVSSTLTPVGQARPLALPWLMEKNEANGITMPRRTFRGVTYHGGVSDHLPLVLDMHVE